MHMTSTTTLGIIIGAFEGMYSTQYAKEALTFDNRSMDIMHTARTGDMSILLR